MKLLLCPNCRDLIALSSEKGQACRCRRVWGRYRTGGHKSVYDGDPVLIGIDSNDLLAAIAFRNEPEALLVPIRAFVMQPGPTIRKVRRPKAEPDA